MAGRRWLRHNPCNYARRQHGRGDFLCAEPRSGRRREGRRGQDHHGSGAGPHGCQAGLSVLIVELEGKSGIAGAFGRTGDLDYEEVRPVGPIRRPPGRRLGTGPADHARRRADGISRGPRPGARVTAAGPHGRPRRGGHRHPRHPRRAGPGQGQAAGARAGGRPDRGGRTSHGPRHHLLDLGAGMVGRRPGRAPAHAGPGRGRPALGPRPVPGDPRHPARGAAGLRDDRVGVHPRGQGRRPARTGHRQCLRPRAVGARAVGGRGGGRRRRDAGAPATGRARGGPALPAGPPRRLGRAGRAAGPRAAAPAPADAGTRCRRPSGRPRPQRWPPPWRQAVEGWCRGAAP